MKINQLKQEVYQLTSTKNTEQLKSKRAELTENKDLRRKDSWIAIYSALKLIDNFQQDRLSQDVAIKYGFKSLSKDSSFADLLNNVRAIGNFCESLELDIDKLEQK